MAVQSWSLLFWLTLSAIFTTKAVVNAASVELVYQYEGAVWVENLAVRPNGWILPATATSAVLTQINPKNGEVQVLHDWSDEGNAIMSITSVENNVFLANTMYCDLTILQVSILFCFPSMLHVRQIGPHCPRRVDAQIPDANSPVLVLVHTRKWHHMARRPAR